MDWLSDLLLPGGKLLGIEWHGWKVVGWFGNLAFFTRFMIQWRASERQKQVVVPAAFWWLSLAGSLLLFSYALFYQRDSVFIFAYAFTWIPYVRNLIIQGRHQRAHRVCAQCGTGSPPRANYCAACGTPLTPPVTPIQSPPDNGPTPGSPAG